MTRLTGTDYPIPAIPRDGFQPALRCKPKGRSRAIPEALQKLYISLSACLRSQKHRLNMLAEELTEREGRVHISMGPVSLGLQKDAPHNDVTRSPKLRALVVDDSLTILHAICSLLEHREIVDVVGRAESGSEAIDAVLNLRPDLVLIDADMPDMSGLRASLLLAQIAPETKVVLMSMDATDATDATEATDATTQFRRACSGCGAYGLIYKPRFLSELAELLQTSQLQALSS